MNCSLVVVTWQENVAVSARHFLRISLETMRNTTNSHQDDRSLGGDSNQKIPHLKLKSQSLDLDLRCPRFNSDNDVCGFSL